MTASGGGGDDVDALMRRVKTDAAARRAALDTTPLDLSVATAAQRNVLRDRLPAVLRVFPFTVPPVERVVLEIVARLTRDQREINAALIAALRERSELDTRIATRIAELETRVRDLEARD